jgi:hypothetical protein
MIQAGDFLHSITLFLSKNIFYLLLAVLALNMFQRRYHQYAQKKRMATLYLGILILVFMVGTILIVNFKLPEALILPLAAVVILLGYVKREHVLPFRLNCRQCGRRMSSKRILFFDANTCDACAGSAPGAESAKGSESTKGAGDADSGPNDTIDHGDPGQEE